MSLSLRAALLVVAAGFAVTTSACTHVAAYDRAQLADPTMVAGELDGAFANHVHAVHEGAQGGGSVAESGCGCN